MPTPNISDADLKRYGESFITWSEGPIGFFPEKRYNVAKQEWFPSRLPIVWEPRQRAWLDHCFTFVDGELPYDDIWNIDIGKSGKTMIGAAVGQWRGMFSDLPGEVLFGANSKDQSAIRTYAQLRRSIELSPVPYTLENTKSQITWIGGNVGRPLPLNAETTAGADANYLNLDEVWGYTSDAAKKMFAEGKHSPTMNISLRLINTYPGYKQDSGPLNDLLDLFFDEEGNVRKNIERPLGVTMPAYALGTTFLWWNHEPYPWHLKKKKGITFLERERQSFKGREEEFRRIWQARVVSKGTTFIDPVRWAACEDVDHMPTLMHPMSGQGKEMMVLGVDIGVKRDTTAVVARGLDAMSGRLPLKTHKIWYPIIDEERPYEPSEVPLEQVGQWIMDLIRNHRVLAIYADPTQAYLLLQLLRKAISNEGFSTKIVEVEQGKTRMEADMAYHDLIYTTRLRNYPQCGDLTQHVLDAEARYTRGGSFRLDKSAKTGVYNDGAVADSQACLGVMELQSEFVRPNLPRRKKKLKSPYKAAYG